MLLQKLNKTTSTTTHKIDTEGVELSTCIILWSDFNLFPNRKNMQSLIEKKKTEGNDLFKEEEFGKAIEKYKEVSR